MLNNKNYAIMKYYQVNAQMQLPMNKELKDMVICDNEEQAKFMANVLNAKGFKVEVWERVRDSKLLYKL